MALLPAMLAVALLLAACRPQPAAPPVAPPEAPQDVAPHKRLEPPRSAAVSLVYGHLDLRDAPTALEWVELQQVAPPTGTPYYQMRVHEGVFYMEKFPTGVFRLGEFGGQRWNGRHVAYALPRQAPALRLTIDAPGLHYLGSFRYREVARGGASAPRFELDRVPEPSEAEVLRAILPLAAGTAWAGRIRDRLAQLEPAPGRRPR